MPNRNDFIISSADIEKRAKLDGITKDELTIPENVILTFNKGIIDEINEQCDLVEWEWKGGKYSLYYSPPLKSWKGKINSKEIIVMVPTMGPSCIATIAEDLIYFGAEKLFLLCASWSLGDDFLRKGQIHLPSFAVGLDGTSPHYGNDEGLVEAEPKGFKALSNSLNKLNVDWREGGVASFEAIYRITPQLVDEFRSKNCLSMENGEVASLFSISKVYDIFIGVLLQPYINLEKGFELSYMDDRYISACRDQAKAALEIINN